MADDTRQPREDLSKEALTVHPENKPFAGSQWQDAKQDHRPANANLLAGGTENTAGGKIPDVTFSNAVSTIPWNDFWSFHKKPCVRDALLTGITLGVTAGGLGGLLGATVWRACSFFVTGSVVSSGIKYQMCQSQRKKEKEGMMRAVEILERKGVEKKARAGQKAKEKEERRLRKEEELEGQYAKAREGSEQSSGGKSWWKVW